MERVKAVRAGTCDRMTKRKFRCKQSFEVVELVSFRATQMMVSGELLTRKVDRFQMWRALTFQLIDPQTPTSTL